MRIRAFRAIRPPADQAARVASVPYDVVDTEGARQLADGNPDSFLHVVRPEIDLPEGISPYDEAVYQKARENLDALQRRGCLQQDEQPSMFLYRLTMGEHRQTGLVTTCHVEDYEKNVIKKHERTLQSKEDDRTRHVATLDANAGPVFLTYPDSKTVDALVAEVQVKVPLYDFVAPDGIRHEAWQVEDGDELVAAFAAIPDGYVADGHHRSASAARVGKERREANPAHTGEEAYNWFLCVLFPASQLQVLAYNRLVRDLHGQTPEQFLEALGADFEVTPEAPLLPVRSRQISMYLGGRWYGLGLPATDQDDPVHALDVSVLQNRVLRPLLGIDDPRTSNRIAFMGGIHGGEGLQAKVDSGEFAIAFSLYPTGVEQLMAIADADQIMPPKSTWFEPKLRSGLFVNPLD